MSGSLKTPIIVLACATILSISSHTMADQTLLSAQQISETAIDAYIYGYPLVTMEITRRIMTNVEKPEGTRAPMGQLVRMRKYPDASFKDVTAPNADTLYTTAWVNVGSEPWVLSLPDAKDRFFLFPMLDGWTNVFQVPGKRTTGTSSQKYAITGPSWKGQLPAGLTQYNSPTALVWILGRIYCTGTPEDYAEVHKMQDEITLVPLSSYGKPFTPPTGQVDTSIDMKKSVRDHVNSLSASEYFNLLATLMRDNPPASEDAPMQARMATIGLVPGKSFDAAKLGPDASKAIESVPQVAFGKIMEFFKQVGRPINGWMYTTKTGIYGTNYLDRALITAIGLGANRPQDAIYPTSEVDSDGEPYDGANSYILHFAKGQTPPANAFWSLTMYDADYFFVDNPLNRYTLSSRNRFKTNPDESIDLFIQNKNPGPEKESNWLPAPSGRFILMMRLYWPRETAPSIIDGSWTIPAVKRVN